MDPSLKQLREVGLLQHRVRLAFNVDTEELLMSSMDQLQSNVPMSLDQLESIMSLGLATARKLHALIRQQQ